MDSSEDDPIRFWDDRYRTGRTPWDFGRAPLDLLQFLSKWNRLGRVLVPGCGSGYEVKTLLAAGNEVVAIDLSAEAVARARAWLAEAAADVVRREDFFEVAFAEGSFGAIYERTFHCALPLSLRPAYFERVRRLLKPGGLLFGYFLYGHEAEPPPYPMAAEEERSAFARHFDLLESRPSQDALPLFAGMERWQVWRLRSPAATARSGAPD